MDRYTVIKEVGDGTFGCVWRAVNKFTGEVVAIKKMKKKYHSMEECMNLREVKSLRAMGHPNIVKLKEVIKEHDVLYLVFEFMELDLYQLMKEQTQLFSESRIRSWCFQIFHALAYIHQCGCFHRDLKPENLLVSKNVIKVADFGLAREVCSKPPFTEYVSTRWYRAPEVLLQSPVYGTEVDMWAMGAIMAELFTLRPLFPGSSEADEIYKICAVIGTPNQNSWAQGLHLANKIKFQFPQFSGVPLSELIPSASGDAVGLIKALCSWDPVRRPSAVEALQHPFFQPCIYIPPALRWRVASSPLHPATAASIPNSPAATPGQKQNTVPWRNNSALVPSASVAVSVPQTDGQRKLDTEKPGQNYAAPLQPRYQPPPRSNYYAAAPVAGAYQQQVKRGAGRLSEVGAKMGQMSLGPVTRPSYQAPMKAGGWHSQPNHPIPAAAAVRTGPRRVAG